MEKVTFERCLIYYEKNMDKKHVNYDGLTLFMSLKYIAIFYRKFMLFSSVFFMGLLFYIIT